jgi:hypothetical protein
LFFGAWACLLGVFIWFTLSHSLTLCLA